MQGQQQGNPAWANPNQTLPATESMEDDFFAPLSTLDEPVMDTIMRDVRAVGSKLKVVLAPLDRNVYSYVQGSSYGAVSQSEENLQLSDQEKEILSRLKDWDLWGPLIVCLGLAVLLSFKAPVGQASLVFAAVFTAVWFGATVVTINAQLLGGTISFFQSVCVLGYCVFPMMVAAALVDVLHIAPLGFISTILELVVLCVAFLWSTRASSVFIGQYITPSRRVLAVFPVLFFYTFLAWMILLF